MISAKTMAELSKTSQPIANAKRAREIAAMDEFSIQEFRELTGVGEGDLGIYRITKLGVEVGQAHVMAELTSIQQHELSTAQTALSLSFPCPPESFIKWFEATQGEFVVSKKEGQLVRAPSDFPLAIGFLDEFDRLNGVGNRDTRSSVSKDEIVAAFAVEDPPEMNMAWWETRLRDVGNYGLASCRAGKGQRGRGGVQSSWYPLSIAAWLIEKKYMPKDRVMAAMRESFSAEDTDLLEDI